MLKSILVGLDGSPHSQVAVELGIRWAKRFDAFLVGLGIIDEPGICGPEAVPLGAGAYKVERDQVRLAEARRRVEGFLEAFTLRCAEAQVPLKLLEDTGQPSVQVLLEAQRFDLILLGRRTYFHFQTQEGPDETLFEVVKHSPRPVVAVPDSFREGTGVLVAYDGSLQAARTLQAFQSSGLGEGTEIHVLTVGKDHTEAARHADRAAEFLRFHDLKVTTHPVASSDFPGNAILQYCWQLDPGLLVMGAYGQPRWREFLFGSVTRALLKQTPVPLFLWQ
jgi:nucleotide-binding universal stress UspA family protein